MSQTDKAKLASHSSGQDVAVVTEVPPSQPAHPVLKGSMPNFKPFARDPDKQARYERYLEHSRHRKQCECY